MVDHSLLNFEKPVLLPLFVYFNTTLIVSFILPETLLHFYDVPNVKVHLHRTKANCFLQSFEH